MSNSHSYDEHFLMSKSVSSHDIAISTCGNTIFHCMPDGIIKSVASKFFCCSAINARRLKNNIQKIFLCNVILMIFVFIYALVCFSQKNSASFVCLPITLLPFSCFLFLIVGQIFPSFRSSILSFFSNAQTILAFIRKAIKPCGIFIEKFFAKWQNRVASKTFSGIHFLMLPHFSYVPHID